MKVKRCFLEWSLVSRRFAVALTFVLGGGMLLAANLVPLKGVVKDASGEPLAGVTVRIKDGKSGTITDVNGHFVLDVEKGKKLLLSYIGYSETEVLVKDDQQMQIVLKEDAQQLQEVVVVGYGTAKKVNLVGAVDQIDSKQIAERSNSNISRSLQGMVPGLNITFSDGKPSRTPSINLRGTGSIGAGGSALVLINGVEGDLNSVNPADVESVSVLKDASSAAIYGARGAFGVILVTTKNATAGKTKINYNGSFSMHQRTVKTEDGIVSNGLQWTDGWYTAYLEGQEAPPGGTMTKTNVQPTPSNSKHHDTPNNKTHIIKFRVTAEEKASLELTCKLLNLSLSTFIRRAIHNVKIEKTVIVTSGGEETLTAVSTLLAQCSKVGTNLNQLARHFNSGGADTEQLRAKLLDELADLTAFRLHAEKVLGELYGNAQAYRLSRKGSCIVQP